MLWVLIFIVVGWLAGILDTATGILLGALAGFYTWQAKNFQQINEQLNTRLQAISQRLEQLERNSTNAGTSSQAEKPQIAPSQAQATKAPPSISPGPVPPKDAHPVHTETAQAIPSAALAAAQLPPSPSSATPPIPARSSIAATTRAAIDPPESPLDVKPPPQTRPQPLPQPRPSATPFPSHKQTPTPFELWIGKSIAAAKAWLLGGNTVLKVGALILFLGFTFLLRFTAEKFTFPVEGRYIGVALSALVLLSLGWWLRARNNSYALIMQGTGIAVLYLTIFAALRLHPLLSPVQAFSLLVGITACLTVLAVLQNSLSMATAAVLGGFAAPILTSTGSGNHVGLFSYFALLNTGIFAIAWFKAWRLLNLVGFIGTFGIGFAWGLRAYTPGKLASTQPFLLIFFLMYVAIGLLFTWRKLRDDASRPEARDKLYDWTRQRGDYIDATTLFGPPLIGFGLQVAIVRHIEFAAAFSALGLGLFYLCLAYAVRARTGVRALLLTETCLALGVVFTSLAIPLGLDARWTSAAWAIEGAGIFWIGLRQARPLARSFALLLQLGAALAFLSQLEIGNTSILNGSVLGSLMLGVALLFSYWQLRSMPAAASAWEHLLQPWLCGAGLSFVYLMAPLLFAIPATTIAWALSGVVTLLIGLRIQATSFLWMAFGIQLLGGLLFLAENLLGIWHLETSLTSGWNSLIAASLVGLGLVVNMLLAVRNPLVQTSQTLLRSLAVVLIIGLVFMNLSIKFVLPWMISAAVWGCSGLLILWFSLQLKQRSALFFSLALQGFAGAVFLLALLTSPSLWGELQRDGLSPLAHIGFWTPCILGIAAQIGAWRLHTVTLNGSAINMRGIQWQPLSTLLLLWGVAWWGLAFASEIWRFVDARFHTMAFLVLGAASALPWTWLALRSHWKALATLCTLLAPYGGGIVVLTWFPQYNPLANWAWIGWLALVSAHYLALRKLAPELPSKIARAGHILGCWLVLAILGLTVRYFMLHLTEQYNAWCWLGWAVLPALYLWLMATPRKWIWPIAAYEHEYRLIAPAPLAIALLIWFWLANAISAGNSAPIPYIPLLNPLELGLLLSLCALFVWMRFAFTRINVHPDQSLYLQYIVAGLSAFALLTAAMLRAAHHWGGVPWETATLFQSMLVQAGLSIIWTLIAIACMLVGHKRMLRNLWLVGSALIALVVIKLFLIELSNSGGLERIISFIAVGVLLLVVGYFAPLPPRRSSETATSMIKDTQL